MASSPFGVYAFVAGDDGAELARDVERSVFLEAFGDTEELLAKEYEPYEPASLFLLAMDHRRRTPAGMMRVIVPNATGFKTLNDLVPCWDIDPRTLGAGAVVGFEEGSTWDIASLAVAPAYRGKAAMGLVTLGLFQGVTMAAVRRGVDWFVAALDVPVLRLLRWRLRLTWSALPGALPRPYLGSTASLPATCRLSDSRRRLAEVDPALHDILFNGSGIAPALAPLAVDDAEALILDLSRGLGAPAALRSRALTSREFPDPTATCPPPRAGPVG
jgi:hypothetical protein